MTTSIDLNSLTSTQGFKISGAEAGDFSGYSVAGVGDVNGDGKVDFMVGARGASSNTGVSYLIYGIGAAFSDLNLANFNSTQGIKITGAAAGDYSGHSVSGLKDVNGDGFDDIAIGAPQCLSASSCTKTGIAYVLFGGDNLVDINLSNFTSTQGFSITGAGSINYCGYSVSGAGNVNGDNYFDILIGAPRGIDGDSSPKTGIAYVILGKASGFTNINLANDLTATSSGFSITGSSSSDWNGYSVSSIGDINKDGYDEIATCGYGADISYAVDVGECYVIYGKSSGFSNLNVGSLGTQGFTIVGSLEGDQLGYSVSGAGDVNQDGFYDFAIGAVGKGISGVSKGGTAYIIYGSSTFSSKLDLDYFTNTQGFYVAGRWANGYTGGAVSGIGDANNDGFSDVFIGSPKADANTLTDSGESYVIYGNTTLQNINLHTQTLTSEQGFYITSSTTYGYSGCSANAIGDFNKDGYADFIVGSYGVNSNAGASYVVYGGPQETDSPTSAPSSSPTRSPTSAPTIKPSYSPSVSPSLKPSPMPTGSPSGQPSGQPSVFPTSMPTGTPSNEPTNLFISDSTDSSQPSFIESNLGLFVGLIAGGLAVLTTAYCTYAKVTHAWPFMHDDLKDSSLEFAGATGNPLSDA